MKGEAFDDWLSIFDINAEKVWRKEREELRRSSMLFHCLSVELKKTQTNIKEEILEIQRLLIHKDEMRKRVMPSTPPKNKRKTTTDQKENTSPNINGSYGNKGSPRNDDNPKNRSSPNKGSPKNKNSPINVSPMNKNSSNNKNKNSPNNKNKNSPNNKNKNSPNNKNKNSPNTEISGIIPLSPCLQMTDATPSLDMLMFGQSTDELFGDTLENTLESMLNEPIRAAEDSSEDLIVDSDSSSPKLDRGRFCRAKKNLNNSSTFLSFPPTSGRSSKSPKKRSPNIVATLPNKSNYVNLEINLKTPKDVKKRLSYDSDTFVECTPEVRPSLKRSKFSKMSMRGTQEKSQGLLQKSGSLLPKNRNLLHLQSSNRSQKAGWTQKAKKKQPSTLTQLFGSQRKADVSSLVKPPVIFDDDVTYVEGLSSIASSIQTSQMHSFKKCKPSTSKETQASIILTGKETQDILNLEFLDEYDNFPERNKTKEDYVYKERVRGNEKKKLDGWECDDCRKFYEGLNLKPEEIKAAKNKCSRHRSKFAPPQETPDGFWDLNTMSTQD